MRNAFKRLRQDSEDVAKRRREATFKNAAYRNLVGGSIDGDENQTGWASSFACTCDAWKERGKFTGKNLVALLVGFTISIVTRLIISDAKKHDPEFFKTSKGANLTVTDVAGSFIALVICSVWVRPSASRMSWGNFCSSPSALGRSALRNGIPFLAGCLSIFLTKFIDYKVNGPDHVYHDKNNNRVVELSDFIGTFLLLVSFHAVDCLLQRCWPADMTQDPNYEERSPMLPGSVNGEQARPAYSATVAVGLPGRTRRNSDSSQDGSVGSSEGYRMR